MSEQYKDFFETYKDYFGLTDNNYFAEQKILLNQDKPVYEPQRNKTFSIENFKEHLEGQHTYGLYTICKKEMTSRFICIDIDFKKETIEASLEAARTMASNIIHILYEYEIDERSILAEFSGSKGIHLFIFFDQPMPAQAVHRLGVDIKNRVKAEYKLEVEVFPKQGSLGKDEKSIGSLIKLPLGLHLASGKYSHFLSVPEFIEYTGDNELLLRNITKISKESFDAMVAMVEYEEKSLKQSDSGNYDFKVDGERDISKMLTGCEFFKYCEKQVAETKTLSNDARKILLTLCVKFGLSGEQYLHNLLSQTTGYAMDKTQSRIESAKRDGYKPARCKTMIYATNHDFCPHQGLCENIKQMGFNYPVNPTALTAPYSIKQQNTLDTVIKLDHLALVNDDEYNNMVIEVPFKVVTNATDFRLAWKNIFAQCHGFEECFNRKCPLHGVGEGNIALNLRPETIVELAQCKESDMVSIIKRAVFNCGMPPKKSLLSMLKTSDVTIQKLVISSASNNFHSPVQIAEDGRVEYTDNELIDEFGYRYQEKLAFYIGNDLEMDQMYKGVAHVVRNPANGQKILVIHSVKKHEYENFKFDLNNQETKKHLQTFANKSLQQILDEITYGITKIYDRNRVLLTVLLTYSSALEFIFNNKQERGWVESIILGDPGLGKTAIVSSIIRMTGLGDIISGHTLTKAGLSGGIEKEKNFDMHMIRWGAYPQNSERLLVIDEAQGMPEDAGKALRSARESGIVKISGIVSGRHDAKTRLVWISNAKNNKVLNQYDCGMQALKELMDPADIRRFDIAITISAGNQNAALANIHWREAIQIMPGGKSDITAEVLKTNILYAWTRKGKNIYFPEHVEQYILDRKTGKAMELASKYSGAEDIPIVNRSDARLTIARLSAAMAILKKRNVLQENWENVTVSTEDVDDVLELLYANYDEDSARLDIHAVKYMNENYLSKEELGPLVIDVMNRIKSEAMSPGGANVENSATYQAIIMFFNKSTIRLEELTSATGISASIAGELFAWLIRKNLIYASERRFNEYTMRARLKVLLNVLNKSGVITANIKKADVNSIVYSDDQESINIVKSMLVPSGA